MLYSPRIMDTQMDTSFSGVDLCHRRNAALLRNARLELRRTFPYVERAKPDSRKASPRNRMAGDQAGLAVLI